MGAVIVLLNLLSRLECHLSLLLNKSKKSLGICMRSWLYFKVCSLILYYLPGLLLPWDSGGGTLPMK